jgi:hypothetical protein
MDNRKRTLTALATLALAGASCGRDISSSDIVTSRTGALATTNDLTVTYIQRLPTLSWVENSTNPKVDGWPTAGQNVTWRGFIKNFSATARTVQWKWLVDGAQVKTGSVAVAANATASADLVRAWDFNRHNIQLTIDPANLIAEDEEGNNSLTVASNAISAGFWVEQSVYDYFLAHQRELTGAQSTCWENWIQRQMGRYNLLFQQAVYAGLTPNGVLDRIRIDEIVVLPDGSLPLNGGGPTNDPDLLDHTVDLEWGFPAGLVTNSTFYSNTTDVSDGNPFYFEPSLLHELGHARYLIDQYGFNVHAIPNGLGRDSIPLSEGGKNIVGTPLLPLANCDTSYVNHQPGLMDTTDGSFLGPYTATALNLIAGNRATQGNVNAPGNIGVFMANLPAENQLTLLDDATGAPLAGANVQVFRSTGNGVLYSKRYATTPSLTLTANASGQVLLGNNPFGDAPPIWIHDTSVVLVRVAHQGRVRYIFLDCSDFNLEFWRGHTSLGLYTQRVHFVPAGGPNPALGFDCATYWTTSAGKIEGVGVMFVEDIAYGEVTSVPLTNQDVQVGGSISYDLAIPSQDPNPAWRGVAQVFISVPSRNVNNAFIGQTELTNQPLDVFNTYTYPIPQWIRTALQGASFTDMTIKIALNVNQGSGAHVLDNFRFNP